MRSTLTKSVYSVASFVTFALLTYLVFSYYAMDSRLWIFFTADTLYIPYLFQDIFVYGGKMAQWKFSPVPYFFPDFTLFSIIALVVKKLKLAIILFGVAQLGMLYGLIVAIGKWIADEKSAVLFRLSVFVAFMLLAGGHLQQETLTYALVSQEHFGGALMYLLGLYLILRNFAKENGWNYFLLGAVSFLTIFSDVVFVTQFFAPVMASLILFSWVTEKSCSRICRRTMLVITVSTLASYFVYRLRFFGLHMSINPHLLSRTHFSEYKLVTLRILQNLSDYYQQNAVFMLLWVVFVFASLFYLGRLFLVAPVKTRMVLRENRLFAFTVTFLFFSIVMGYISLLLTDNDVLMPGNNGMRHYQTFLLFPVFLGIPAYLTRYTNLSEVLHKHYLLLLAALLSCGFLFAQYGSLSNILNYYPASVACLDEAATKYHLQNGVADYWDAKPYNFLSKQHINSAAIEIDHVTHEVDTFLWMNTLHDYVGKEFTFLIVNGALKKPEHLAILRKKFGEPMFKFYCPTYEDKTDQNEIDVYRKGVITSGISIGFD